MYQMTADMHARQLIPRQPMPLTHRCTTNKTMVQKNLPTANANQPAAFTCAPQTHSNEGQTHISWQLVPTAFINSHMTMYQVTFDMHAHQLIPRWPMPLAHRCATKGSMVQENLPTSNANQHAAFAPLKHIMRAKTHISWQLVPTAFINMRMNVHQMTDDMHAYQLSDTSPAYVSHTWCATNAKKTNRLPSRNSDTCKHYNPAYWAYLHVAGHNLAYWQYDQVLKEEKHAAVHVLPARDHQDQLKCRLAKHGTSGACFFQPRCPACSLRNYTHTIINNSTTFMITCLP